jgi:Ca-activated chloride channel family protein
VTALYELELKGEPRTPVATVQVRYKEPHSDSSTLAEFPVRAGRVPIEATSNDMRHAVAVAELGLLLRKSQFAGDASYEQVVTLARGALGTDLDGSRDEFLHLAQSAQQLADHVVVAAKRE